MERIVAAATAMVDEDGAEALSMRALAQRLDSGTATLYRHFKSRAQLTAHVIDAVLGAADIDVAAVREMPWQQSVETVARTMFEVFRSHPHVPRLLAGRIPMGPNAMRQREVMLAVLLDAGFGSELAAQAYATVARYVLGFAIQLGEHATDDDAELPETWRAQDPQSYPATVAVADHLPVGLDREFSLGLDLILNGLTQLLDDA
ncbi:TetR/AcrR family transcriptional regulator [Mycolicibacterium brisbanense]|uniref:TetR-family transcriptional regulator n=1 Tax=Mycolicibacterium brisbanense TaxID=146020 RepID=A0A117I410_9MYCO|nr:TetR/AcrR family transcriptional regulator [Mycolicibacterium brisbanense]GAS86193.1 TetR-family transcriptional regulator [Mycolicibacterium brisbanense]